MSRRAAAAVALVAAAIALAAPAIAEAQQGVAQAKALFEGGAMMYDRGHYIEAVQAFEAAYRLAPRPGILFSIAQAHKKQFFFDKNPTELVAAMRSYREYVDKTPTGGRRAEAVASIAELEPYTARVDMSKAVVAAPVKQETRLMVQSSAPGVDATVDGQRSADETLHWTVKAGKHLVHAEAPGFVPQDREVVVREGDYESVLFELKELPAHLTLETSSGAQVSIDGRLVGTTPLVRALDVDQGRHLVTVTKSGYKAYSEEIEFAHGQNKAVKVPLTRTGQRIASYVVFGAGAIAAVVGGSFAVVAVAKQTTAKDLDTKRTTPGGGLTEGELADYNDALTARDNYKRAGAIALAAAAAFGGAGLMLYVFDTPVVSDAGGSKSDDRGKKPGPLTPRPPRELEMSFAPTFVPGYAGGALTMRF